MKRKSKRSSSSKFKFEKLEPRQLLAADVIGAHQALGGELTSVLSVVSNGDFETTGTASGNGNFYAADQVDGWSSRNGGQLNIFGYNGYGNVLDLDSTAADIDDVFQSVAVEDGMDYIFAFDFRNNPAVSGAENAASFDFEVLVAGAVVGRYTGGDIWSTGVVAFTADGTSEEIGFREVVGVGTGDDGIGPLLDNIRVVEATGVEVENSSFESPLDQITVEGDSPTRFNNSEFPGWSAVSPDGGEGVVRIGSESPSSFGPHYLNLDINPDFRDVVVQDLATTAGDRYYVVFSARNDGDAGGNDEMRVRWNGQWGTTVHADADWQDHGFIFTADSSETELVFLEAGVGDGDGPYIDNVRMYKLDSVSDLLFDADVDSSGLEAVRSYASGIGAIPIGDRIGVSNADVQSVTLQLTGNVDGNSELLALGSSNAQISVSDYDQANSRITLTGTATAAEYQAVLRSLAYFNGQHSQATRGDRQVVMDVVDVLGRTQSATIQINYLTDQSAIDDAILQKFIADNNLNAVSAQEGLFAVIDEPGQGLNPTANDSVRVAYTGRFLTVNDQNQIVEGESFDASSESGISFSLGQVIRGWTLGIPLFRTGGSGKLLIPSQLAYGQAGRPTIPPNSVLIFDVELLQVFS